MNFSDSLAAFIRWVMRDTKYLKLYPGEVQSYAGGVAQAKTDDPEIGNVNAEVNSGLAGGFVEPSPGTRCLVGFRAKDPSRPYVALWDSVLAEGGGAVRLDDGNRPIARVGDSVELNFSPGVPTNMEAVLTGETTAPGPIVTPVPPTPGVITFTFVDPPRASIQNGNTKITA